MVESRDPVAFEGSPGRRASLRRRLATVFVSMTLTASALVILFQAFRLEPPPAHPGGSPPASESPRVENGLLAFRASEIWVIHPDGSGLRRLNRLECINDACDVVEGSLILTPWEWSPDGRTLACYGYPYHRADSGGADYGIYLMNADGTNIIDLTSQLPELAGTSQGNPHWSPDGTRVAFDNDDGLYVVNADGTNVIKVAEGALATWSPDGTRLAFMSGGDIHVANADGSAEVTFTHSNGFEDSPAWSPDGMRIAYIGAVKGEGQQLYVVGPDGTNETRLTDLRSESMGGYSPSWSPDGVTIAVEVLEMGNENIYLVSADGSEVRRLTDAPGDENRPTWSPDGRKLAYMGSTKPLDDAFDLYTINTDGSDPRRLTDGMGAPPGALTWQPLIPEG